MTEAPYAQLVLDADEALHGGLAHGKRYRALALGCDCDLCAFRRRLRHPIEGEAMTATRPDYGALRQMTDDERDELARLAVIEPEREPDDDDDEPPDDDDDEPES